MPPFFCLNETNTAHIQLVAISHMLLLDSNRFLSTQKRKKKKVTVFMRKVIPKPSKVRQLLVGCITSHATISQRWICLNNSTYYHTETDTAHQTCYLIPHSTLISGQPVQTQPYNSRHLTQQKLEYPFHALLLPDLENAPLVKQVCHSQDRCHTTRTRQ